MFDAVEMLLQCRRFDRPTPGRERLGRYLRMSAQSKFDCDIDALLDEALTLLQSAAVDVRPTALLMGKLRTCAEQARDAGDAKGEQRMRQVADELERRLRAP
jgi:hypothetical protein